MLSEPELTLAKPTEIALAMEAAAKDTLELQGSKESEVYIVINGGNSDQSPAVIVIDVVVLLINDPSVTLGTKRAGNVGKWAM